MTHYRVLKIPQQIIPGENQHPRQESLAILFGIMKKREVRRVWVWGVRVRYIYTCVRLGCKKVRECECYAVLPGRIISCLPLDVTLHSPIFILPYKCFPELPVSYFFACISTRLKPTFLHSSIFFAVESPENISLRKKPWLILPFFCSTTYSNPLFP